MKSTERNPCTKPEVNLPDLRGLLAYVHGVRHHPSDYTLYVSEIAIYRAALAQVEVALEGLIAALEEHK